MRAQLLVFAVSFLLVAPGLAPHARGQGQTPGPAKDAAPAISPEELPDAVGAWTLRIVTSGGFSGRGIGNILVTSQGQRTCDPPNALCATAAPDGSLDLLARAISAASPSGWGDSKPSTICRDCVSTSIVLRRRESDGATRTYVTHWDNVTRGSTPAEATRIYDMAMALRAP